MTIPAIQIATLCRDIDSKEVGMDEIINGGTTSVGAQLRKFQHPTDPVDIRTPAGTIEKRAFTVHAPLATGDFPAMAAMLAVKGSTSAHRYDRLSTIDQRSPHYGKPNSMLRPNTPGIPSWFKRVTHEDVDEVLAKAAAAPAAQREAMLTDIGRNVSSYDFDNRGGYVANYPFARIPLLDDIDGISTDEMHTSLSSGTGAQEGYLQQYYNIRIKKYYNLNELNQEVKMTNPRLPPGVTIPEFGRYVKEGTVGNLPNPSQHLKFSASEIRHWLEHGTHIMESLFARKKITSYSTDSSWLSWLALVRVETAALGQAFDPEAIIRLDDLQLQHHAAFLRVEAYSGTAKPKLFMRANYPVDIQNTGLRFVPSPATLTNSVYPFPLQARSFAHGQ